MKAHRDQVMRKMQADSLPDLVTMAARLGLLSGADPLTISGLFAAARTCAEDLTVGTQSALP